MGALLIVIAIALLSSSVRGDPQKLAALVGGDFTGKGNFLFWTAALVTIGMVGYIGPLRTFSRVFMALIIIVIVVVNQGLFATLNKELRASGADNVVRPDFQKGK